MKRGLSLVTLGFFVSVPHSSKLGSGHKQKSPDASHQGFFLCSGGRIICMILNWRHIQIKATPADAGYAAFFFVAEGGFEPPTFGL